MEIQTKFLRLRAEPALGDRIEGWRVCWLGGWDRGRVFFVVMVEQKSSQPARARRTRKGGTRPIILDSAAPDRPVVHRFPKLFRIAAAPVCRPANRHRYRGSCLSRMAGVDKMAPIREEEGMA